MSEVKWIKLATDIFDDEKILLIESLPSADSLIVIWFKLLCMAGKANNNGVFLMSNRIAYTDEMLASIFRRDVNTVRFALETFSRYGMIDIVEDVITIPNWDKHQSLDAYEAKKIRDRAYQQKRRDKQKLLIESSDNRLTLDDSSPDVAFSEEDKEEDKDKKKKDTKHRYGEFSHVLLTESEYEKLGNKYGWDIREKAIKFLDEYIEEKGYKSKSHSMSIQRWVLDAVKEKDKKSKSTYEKNQFNRIEKQEYNFSELEKQLLGQ